MKTPLRVRYQTYEFDEIDIHLCSLRNRQEYDAQDQAAADRGISSAAWPIFGVIWPSALVLAHHLKGEDTQSKRILEIGCGIAVSSHLLNQRGDDITAMDYNPAAGVFLQKNTKLNNENPIPFECTNWFDKNSQLTTFDLIIGSDITYDSEAITPLASFINRHAKTHCKVVLVDAGRGFKSKIGKALAVFGFTVSETRPVDTTYLDGPFKGFILSFQRG